MSAADTDDLVDRARAALRSVGDLPTLAGGRTRERLAALRAVGREDLSVARLVEPHLDATAILGEAGRADPGDALHAVWASRSSEPPRLRRRGDAGVLSGTQPFATGAELCDVALVAAVDEHGGDQLVAVDLVAGRADGTIVADTSTWATPAFAGTSTGTVTFLDHPIGEAAMVGPPGFYLSRPGFWHGALAPAAVWAGGAAGLVDVAERLPAATSHERVGRGELRILAWSMAAQLDAAADESDTAPDDVAGARRRALGVRHLVERQCVRALDVFGRTYGPRHLAFDAEVVARVAELQLYVRQVHHGGDLEELGADGDVA